MSTFVAEFKRSYTTYRMKMSDTEVVMEMIGKNESSFESALEKLEAIDNVIGIVGQYSEADFKKNKGYWGHGVFVFFAFNNTIKYCYTYASELSSSVSICGKIRLKNIVQKYMISK